MKNVVIRADRLGKQYRIGVRRERYKALRDALTDAALRPFRAVSNWGRRNGQSEKSGEERFWALKDASFEVSHGETVGVIGRNGAGKSTLLKILSRITEPTTGRAEIRGRVGSLLEVGSGFHPELSGRDNVFLNGAILGMKKAEIDRKFDEIVAFAEVERFIDMPVKRYSSGMHLRLAFAVAAHLEPEILLVDEVLAVGDALFQKKCLGKMGEVSRQGRTVLFVSHNMTAVQSLCSRAIWLQAGEVLEAGNVRTVVGRYLQSCSTSSSEETWDVPSEAPGDDRLRLHHISVRPHSPASGSVLTVATPLQIEVRYWNFVPNAILNVSVELYNMEEVCVFNSFAEPRTYPPGLLYGICDIPGNLLNASMYRVKILLVRDANTVVLERDGLTFEVHDVERKVPYYGKWIGAVRPILQWQSGVAATDHVSAACSAGPPA